MSPPPFSLRPGDRVRVGGAAATVRYVGPVAGQGDDDWIGLEWDDPARGKHGGAVGGRHYFSVRPSAPASGSFVRAPALAAAAPERGVCLVTALAARYGGGGDAGAAAAVVVGGDRVAERQARLGELEVASVAGMVVGEAGPSLATVAPSLVDLDASRTLLPGWPALAALGAALPRLARLDVTRVPLHLAPPPPFSPPAAPLFAALRTLILAETGASWGDALAAAAAAPALAALSLRGCGLMSLAPPPTGAALTALTELDVSANPALTWGAVEGGVGRLPSLARLDISNCAATTALAPRAPHTLTALTSLCLAGTSVRDWGEVGRLASFPALRAVRLPTDLPPPSPSAGDARADAVARLPPTVTHLNGASVSAFERRDATRALAAASTAAPPPPQPLAATMVRLEVGGRSLRLPASTPLGRVRALAVRGGGSTLVLRRAGRDGAGEELGAGDDGRDLAWLGVGDGDRIEVVA